MAVCLMYYGVTFNAGNIGDFYLNFFLMGIVEFPGILATIFLIDRIGRKKLHLLCMMLGGVACLCTIFTVTFARESKWISIPGSLIKLVILQSVIVITKEHLDFWICIYLFFHSMQHWDLWPSRWQWSARWRPRPLLCVSTYSQWNFSRRSSETWPSGEGLVLPE